MPVRGLVPVKIEVIMKKEYSSIFRSIDSSGNTLWGDGFTVYVRCPYCGDEWVHHGEPKCIEYGEFKQGAVIIPMEGECGSKWEIGFGEHKGNIGAFIQLIEACEKQRYVYFIEAVGLQKIKIGVSDDPKKRLEQLSVGSPVKLKLVGTIQGDNNLEKELHSRFAYLNSDREWFHATKELTEYIKSITSQERDERLGQ